MYRLGKMPVKLSKPRYQAKVRRFIDTSISLADDKIRAYSLGAEATPAQAAPDLEDDMEDEVPEGQQQSGGKRQRRAAQAISDDDDDDEPSKDVDVVGASDAVTTKDGDASLDDDEDFDPEGGQLEDADATMLDLFGGDSDDD